jgi:hypothetical protein
MKIVISTETMANLKAATKVQKAVSRKNILFKRKFRKTLKEEILLMLTSMASSSSYSSYS